MIKFLKTEHSGPTTIKKEFLKEFSNHFRSKDDNIVKLIGWTKLADDHGLVMEFMKGESLQQCK